MYLLFIPTYLSPPFSDNPPRIGLHNRPPYSHCNRGSFVLRDKCGNRYENLCDFFPTVGTYLLLECYEYFLYDVRL